MQPKTTTSLCSDRPSNNSSTRVQRGQPFLGSYRRLVVE